MPGAKRGVGRTPEGGVPRAANQRGLGNEILSAMSNEPIPFFTRDVVSYRHWLLHSDDPEVLRELGIMLCDEIEAINVSGIAPYYQSNRGNRALGYQRRHGMIS